MGAAELIDVLRAESMERLRHHILREAGIPPLSLRARLISNRRLLRYACHLALDAEESGAAAQPESGSFDPERFLKMKEERHGGI